MQASNSARRVVVTADDYGLTHNINQTILETADHGALTRVSILVNGLAFDHAIEEFKKRPGLDISLHLNLTEGRALSGISSLTTPGGYFRYSSPALLIATLFSGTRYRAALQLDVEREIRAQLEKLKVALDGAAFSIDGHQHVHMIPMVLKALLRAHQYHRFVSMRVPHEVFAFAPGALFAFFGMGLFRHAGLNVLSRHARWHLHAARVTANDGFIGTLLSGKLSIPAIRETLAQSDGKVEIGAHPGSAEANELVQWSGNIQWHLNKWRQKEADALCDPELGEVIRSYETTGLTPRADARELLRFFIAGGVATGTNITLTYVFTDIMGWWYVASAITAYICAFVVSFMLQKFWAFEHYSLSRVHWETFMYLANTLGGLAFDAVGLYVLVEYMHVWYIAAQVLLLAAIATWNFFIYRFIIFKKPPLSV